MDNKLESYDCNCGEGVAIGQKAESICLRCLTIFQIKKLNEELAKPSPDWDEVQKYLLLAEAKGLRAAKRIVHEHTRENRIGGADLELESKIESAALAKANP